MSLIASHSRLGWGAVASWIAVVFLVAPACGGSGSPASPSTSPPSSPIAVRGTERFGWDQFAPDTTQLARFQYVTYVDNVPQSLVNAVCQNGAGATQFTCAAPLPRMPSGSHRLELATAADGIESPRSTPLDLLVASTTTSAAVSDPLSQKLAQPAAGAKGRTINEKPEN